MKHYIAIARIAKKSGRALRGTLAAAFIILVFACDDFVGVDPPDAQLNTADVFQEKATANAAMSDIYAKMRDAGVITGTSSGISFLMGIYTDELDYYSAAQSGTADFYNNALQAAGSEVKALWDNSYSQVYAANAMIEGVRGSTALAQQDRNQLTGEALFVRALLHSYLAGLFGEVPYIETTDYRDNSRDGKLPVGQVYQKCIADLQQAVGLLPEAYVVADRTRPNRYAAQALLARVALYAGDYALASDQASAILNHTALYAFQDDLQLTFRKESPSIIWQLSPGFEGANTLEAATFIFTESPPPLAALSQGLMEAFPLGDLRKQHWTAPVSDGAVTWYYPAKYKTVYSAAPVEHSVVLRLGELYLVRAEARARAGELIGAAEDINRVRIAAGLLPTTAATPAALLSEILLQRRLELFTEFGHRFFDLKRFGNIDGALTPVKPGWDSNDARLPIPQSELNLNPALAPQNPGY
jgi:hypothetical protein